MRIKSIKLNVPLAVDPSAMEGPYQPPRRHAYIIESWIAKKGERRAARENLTEDANNRRAIGLFKTWAIHYKKRKGIKIMSAQVAKKRAEQGKITKRNKARLTVAKEAREIQEMARQSAAAAMEVAREIMEDPKSRGSDRLAAANLVLERAYGKATQTNVTANVNANGTAKEVSGEELDQRIKTALRRVEEVAGRTAVASTRPQRPTHLRKRNRDTGGASVH